MANFSSRKNPNNPASNVANKACTFAPDSNASGSACNKEVESNMPTDRLTSRSTIFDSRLYEKKAAAEILIRPASVVASKMDDSVVLIFSLGSCVRKLAD